MNTVAPGLYWNRSRWEMTLLMAPGVLPWASEAAYWKIPTLAFMLVAPLMGALYVCFLPFVGFAMVLNYAARGAKYLAVDVFMRLMVLLSPHWAPGEAYLASKRK